MKRDVKKILMIAAGVVIGAVALVYLYFALTA